MPEKKKTAAAAPAVEAPAAEAKETKETKTRKSAKAPARRSRPTLAPEQYVEMGGEQYNITAIIDRAKADYRTTHKVGVQSCKVYVKPEEGAAYYVIINFSGKLDLLFFPQGRRLHRTVAAPAIPTIRLHKQKRHRTAVRCLFLHKQQSLRTPASARGSYALLPGPGPGSRTHSARWR